jgi:DedD protein
MGLLSFLQRRKASPAAGGPRAAEPETDIGAARTRARRRLTGAAVLVLIGVIGFPLVFETQPRPIPVDIPIEIPRKDGAPALAMPAPRPAATRASAAATVAAPREEVVTETRADAGREVSPAASVPAVRSAAASAPAVRAAASAPAARAAASMPAAVPRAAASAPARAAAAPASAPRAAAATTDEATDAAGRFVVQVGAFADAAAARETRGKVEKLGLKTYTQVVETSSGSRIRVRAGPFASREEADKALAKAKAAGMTAVVLTL